MIVGVQEHEKVNNEFVSAAGFDFVELKEQNVELRALVDEKNLYEYLEVAKRDSYPYLVISTLGKVSFSDFKDAINENAEIIRESGIPIYLENGVAGDDFSGYFGNDFSNTCNLSKYVEWANGRCNSNQFGICVNTGYVNLLSQSIRRVIEGAGNYLKLIHVNDNDGVRNTYQMPYSFTKGRGTVTTDYHKFVGALSKMKYDERIVFDTVGLLNRTPEILIPAMMDMLASIALFWLHIIDYGGMLDCGRKIILFGSGRMASNFMHIWGDRYKPAFMVDNDEKKWGSFHRGIEVKSPNAILDVPKDDRLVIICNTRYEEIGMQLDMMGVDYTEYDDNYFDFIIQ